MDRGLKFSRARRGFEAMASSSDPVNRHSVSVTARGAQVPPKVDDGVRG